MNCLSFLSRLLKLTSLTMCVTIISTAFGQSGAPAIESVNVPKIADPSPEWLVNAVKSDDFSEPAESAPVASLPYSELPHKTSDTTAPLYRQPAGSLTGKTLFAMAGHGWTYDNDKMYYYTQRGLSQGMVEDMGNADQMHIFAHLIFNAGANVFPLKPIDHQPNERVLDNTMPQVKFYGTWRAGTAQQFYGASDAPVKYAVTSASLTETAVARYQPYIPESGYYPVYAWARDGADRTNQLYRVKYTGGTAEIQVNWRRAGKSWAWLGTYYFEKGWNGYVDISNQVNDPYEMYYGGLTVADAVRFGNGKGEVPRPGGISGFNREDEGDSYWIQQALGATADSRISDIGIDGNSTVSSPPKASGYINRETEGTFFDRLLISFHSNASTGKARGAIGLYNANVSQRPTFQESLAQFTGEETNRQMLALPSPTETKWLPRERHTYNGINFGELRRDYLQNEMCATIIETAFHDNKEDVTFLTDPQARIGMAEAALRAINKWYNSIAMVNAPGNMPPSRPSALSAQIETNNNIKIRYKLGAVDEFQGDPAKTIRLYRSDNGFGFDGGIPFELTTNNEIAIDPLTTTGVTFLRLTASNSAGESLPSQTIAVCPGNGKAKREKIQTLLLSTNNALDRSANAEYKLGVQPGGPYKPEARTERVRAIYAMMEPSGAAEALAMAACGIPFDGADSSAIDNDLIKPTQYQRVFVAAELQGKLKPALSTKIHTNLKSILEKGGKIMYSGYNFANESGESKGSGQKFETDILGISAVTTATAAATITSADAKFLPTTFTLQLAPTSRSWDEQQTLLPKLFEGKKGRSLSLLEIPGKSGSAAILTRPFASEGEAISLAFPLSMVKDQNVRNVIMAAIDKQL